MADPSPSELLATVALSQAAPVIRNGCQSLKETGFDYTQYVALITVGESTANTVQFKIRLIPIEDYLNHISATASEFAQGLRKSLPPNTINVVFAFEGRLMVRPLTIEDDGPVETTPINVDGESY